MFFQLLIHPHIFSFHATLLVNLEEGTLTTDFVKFLDAQCQGSKVIVCY